MEDKVKEFRDKNPILDFLAGFIPGVGEAQDAHDFIHAAKDKDYISMGLAATGLIIPGITGGQIKKLSNVLIKKGWRETKGRIFDPQGVEYIRNKEGKLQSLSSYKQTQAIEKRIEENKSKAKARSNQQKKVIKEHNEEAEKFRLRTGLDYSLENWQSLASGHKMSQEEIDLFTKKAFPQFVQTYNELIKSGKLIRQPNGRYTANGRKNLSNIETMYYIQANSPQGKNLLYNGITMRSGIKDKHSFETGKNNQNYEKWFSSNPRGAKAYGDFAIWGLPVKPSIINPNWDDQIRLIKRQKANPSSNNWAGGPIGAYLSKDRTRSVNMSEGVLTDDYATQVLNSDPIKGVFTIVGPDIPVKSVFGGSGMYDVSPKKLYNPFLSLTMMGMLGYKHLNKDE